MVYEAVRSLDKRLIYGIIYIRLEIVSSVMDDEMLENMEVAPYADWLHSYWVGSCPNPTKIPAELFRIGCLVKEVMTGDGKVYLVIVSPDIIDEICPLMNAMIEEENIPFSFI